VTAGLGAFLVPCGAARERFQVLGTTPHRHEEEALAWLEAALPGYAPYSTWAPFSFQTDDGRRYEVDALVLTPRCLYVLELKAWRGSVVDGDARTLTTSSTTRGREVEEHPLALLEKKAAALGHRIRRVGKKLGLHNLSSLRYEPLVWLSHSEGFLGMSEGHIARSHVVCGRQELQEALRDGRFPGAPGGLGENAYAREIEKALRRVLADKEHFGLGGRHKAPTVLNGQHELGELIEEGPGYQDRWTLESKLRGHRRRVRSYLAPKSEPAVVEKVQRRAQRETTVLLRLGEHPDILALEDFDPEGPMGPALIFRGFAGKSLDLFSKEQRDEQGQPTLCLDDKLAILRRVAGALSFCHRNEVVHGALSPQAVLVARLQDKSASRDGTTALQVKLSRFALALSDEEVATADGTRLFTRLAGAQASVYEAPEVARGLAPSPASDLFSLGALAYLLFTGEPPAESAPALLQKLQRDVGLRAAAVSDAAEPVDEAIFAATCVDPGMRAHDFPTPLAFVEARLAGVARLVERLTLGGRTCLLMELAGERTLADELRAHGALSLDYARRWGEDLLNALRSLEEAGVQHRDIKPANIGLTASGAKSARRLLLFDFSLASAAREAIVVGTPAYRDPALALRGAWDDAADRWSAALTLYEMFTGTRPAPVLSAPAPGQVAVRLEPERLDADVRDGLLAFFERCFRYFADERHATADDMRDAFLAALHRVPERAAPEVEEQEAPRELDLRALGPADPLRRLPLSARQMNALDRMGLYTLHELAGLKQNRLSGVRGVGTRTAEQLLALAERVRAHLELSASDEEPPLVPGYRGAPAPVLRAAEQGQLSTPLAHRLAQAGLVSAERLAAAPRAQVKNLLREAKRAGAPEKLKDVEAWLAAQVDTARRPETLQAVVDFLVDVAGNKPGLKGRQRLRAYLGLDELPGFSRHGRAKELAEAQGVHPAVVSVELQPYRNRWKEGEPLRALLAEAHGVLARLLEESGGVVPLSRAANALLERYPPEAPLPPTEVRRLAEALARLVTEVPGAELGVPAGGRVLFERRPAEPLLALDKAALELAAALGAAADDLVAKGEVAAEAAAAQRLRAALEEQRGRLREEADPRRDPVRGLPAPVPRLRTRLARPSLLRRVVPGGRRSPTQAGGAGAAPNEASWAGWITATASGPTGRGRDLPA
jgi:serine/threonine protein kinase